MESISNTIQLVSSFKALTFSNLSKINRIYASSIAFLSFGTMSLAFERGRNCWVTVTRPLFATALRTQIYGFLTDDSYDSKWIKGKSWVESIQVQSKSKRKGGYSFGLDGIRQSPTDRVKGKKVGVLLFNGSDKSNLNMSTVPDIYLAAGAYVQQVDFRSSGLSGGPLPDVDGTHLDVEAIVDAAAEEYDVLIFHGISLGAHHAIYAGKYAAEKRLKVHAVRAIQPFGSIDAVIQGLGFPWPIPQMAQAFYPYDNVADIEELANYPSVKIEIYRGEKDEMMYSNKVEDPNAEKLYKAASKINKDVKLIDVQKMEHAVYLCQSSFNEKEAVERLVREAAATK